MISARVIGYAGDELRLCLDCGQDNYWPSYCSACGAVSDSLLEKTHDYGECVERYNSGLRPPDYIVVAFGPCTPERGAFVSTDRGGHLVAPITTLNAVRGLEFCDMCGEGLR